jgi:ABC-type branched-subunit amino acid transport system ATPase component/ABC-type branched-subunit amino acid transport system permease subunit
VTALLRLLPGGARIRWLLAVAFIALVLVIPPLATVQEQVNPDSSARFTIFLATSAVVLALWAVSYNLMLGYAGLVSFAHAAYYGVGAYTVAIFYARTHGSLLVGLALAPLVTGVIGLLTGIVALRAVRLYFSLLTLAISQLLFQVAFQAYDLTGGDNGLHGLTPPGFLSDYTPLYYFVTGVVLLCLLLMFVIVRSPLGAALSAVRENRQRASAVGINVKAYELAVYTIASIFGGVAGGLYAFFQLEAYPGLLFWTANAQPIVVALLGGTGSFLGPALGAFVYTLMSSTIAKNYPYQFDIVLGAIVLAVVLVAPGGLVSLPRVLAAARRRLRGAPAIEEESTGAAIESMDVERAARVEAIKTEDVPPGAVLLELSGVTRHFGGLRAVDNVNLQVRQGDRHAIIGPNGAGKSTLFNLVTGRLRPTAGRVVFDGRDITGHAPHAIARQGIGRAFQITNVFPQLSVRQNLQFSMQAIRGVSGRPFGIADRIYEDEARALLDAVGLGRYADTPAGQLSHGDQRALELAISLALGSKLLLLDEPTAGMSPYETRKAMELVHAVSAERGLTLLFCEHDMEVVFGTARTVTVMNQGRILVEGTPDQVRANPDVRRVYLGELEELPA